ncbi:MAG: exo-beta-N-acetylmuramidase NamZ domain-containing protein, partial [Methyloligellaceae bacterium]
MNLGIDNFLANPDLRKPLAGRRAALLGHPASVTRTCRHTFDALAECSDIRLTSAFGPQHGMRGDKQDNMVESDDYEDPRHGIPVFSLYGEVRYPTEEMMGTFDVLIVDVQDIG